jgi:hypothetical protein
VIFLRPFRIVEREAGDAAAAFARIHPGRYAHRTRIVADLDVMLVRDVEAFDVLAHQHDVDVLVAPGNDGARRPHVGVQHEFFAQADVDRAETAADRGR